MYYDIANFPFLNSIISNVDVLANEYAETHNKLNELKNFFKDGEMPPVYPHFDYWIRESGFDPSQIGYDARGKEPVGGFPLYKKGFPVKWMDVPTLFPKTYDLIMGIENAYFAQYSIMSPHSHILPHKHTVDSYIFHINLFDLDRGDAVFIVNNQTKILNKRGDHLLFNPIDTHESFNNSESFRVNLMIDFRPNI